ncbi:TrkH family potassium uptake protein [Agromyces binzhouensis]|uniref:TrkH family potassium uptake protein n=1 Tax=Agromyces binzhouensis TaxID=1817495 RepID=UPI00362DFF57
MTFRASVREPRPHRFRRGIRLHPAQAVVVGFAAAVIAGTLLLWLPPMTVDPGGTSFTDALFTATSAVCVTGLTVVDTELHWSPLGHSVILLLIQLGGLGIMIFASLIGLVLARKMSVRSRLNTAAEAKAVGYDDVRGLVRGIVLISFGIEAVTWLFLFPRFLFGYDYQPADAAWYALFHSVSSFNNAGFALYTNNMMDFVADPFVCLPMCAAIILGGLGFPVIMQLRKEFGHPRHWSMNTKLVLWGTVVLLAGGFAYLAVAEWNNEGTFGPLSPGAKLLAAFFMSTQARTAGFNSIDVGRMHDESWVVMDVLMFIGGGPAGTAGGIKVTTFAVLYFILLTEFRGEGAVNIFGKRLSRAVHRQAITVALVAVGAVMTAIILLMHLTKLDLDLVAFEAVSAFATVGLSTGITGDLPPSAEVVLVLLMFLGRIGPLTLGSAIALRDRRILYELPKERPAIG